MVSLTHITHQHVTLVTPAAPAGSRVMCAFTQRTGGVSTGIYASLNLGSRVGDKDQDVHVNRQRVLDALGVPAAAADIFAPKQVHGNTVVTIEPDADLAALRQLAEAGCDAVVCSRADLPVLLVFADCVPIIVRASDAFAVIHAGWKGCANGIIGKALTELARVSADAPESWEAYVGPHIGEADYEVSEDLAEQFVQQFGTDVRCYRLKPELPGACMIPYGVYLDLGLVVAKQLAAAHITPEHTVIYPDSTASHSDRFFSYRAAHGSCGRHGAIAYLAKESAC